MIALRRLLHITTEKKSMRNDEDISGTCVIISNLLINNNINKSIIN